MNLAVLSLMIDFEQIFAQEQAENPSRQIHAQTNVEGIEITTVNALFILLNLSNNLCSSTNIIQDTIRQYLLPTKSKINYF